MTDTQKLREQAKQAQSYPGDWQVQTSNSWRRIGTPRADGSVLRPTVARDGHPDLTSTKWTLDYIVAACNATPGLCDTIDTQAAEIVRLRNALADAQKSLDTIATLGGSKADFMGTMRQVREYANSRARMARCALAQEGQGVNQSLTTERDGAAKGADHA